MRTVGKIILVVSGLVLGLWAAAVLVLRSPTMRERLATQVAAVLSDEDRTVSIGGLGGALPFAPTAANVEIRDRRGTWLRIEGLVVEIDPVFLLLRHVHVRSATADRVVLSRLPEPDEHPFVLRPVRLVVTAKHVEVGAIELGKELLRAEDGPAFSAPIAAEAKGYVDLRRLTLDVDLSASSPRLDDLLRTAGISTSSARLDVKAVGAIAAPGGHARLSVADVRHGDAIVSRLDLHANAERLGMGERRYRVTVSTNAYDLMAQPAVLQWLGGRPSVTAVVRFGTTPKVFDVDAMKIEAATFGAEMAGHSDGDGRVEISQLAITWPDVSVPPALTAVAAHGALRVRGTATVTDAWTAPSVHARLTGDALGLQLADERIGKLIGASPRMTADLRYGESRELTADSLALIADAFRVDARGSVTREGHVTASADVTVPDASALAVESAASIAGSASANVVVDGTVDAFDATVRVRPKSLRISGAQPIDGEVAVSGRGRVDAIAGTASARLTFGTHPARADARYSYDAASGLVRVAELSAALPGVTAEGDGDVQLGPMLVRGRARIRGDDLSLAARSFGVDAAGEAAASLELEHDGKRQRGHLQATGREVRIDELLLQSVELDAATTSAGGEARFSLSGAGRYHREFVIRTTGVARGDFDRADITLDRLDGNVDVHSFASRRPVQVAVREGSAELSDFALDLAGGAVEGKWGAGGIRGVGRFRFSGVPLQLTSLASPRPVLLGHVSGEIARTQAGRDLEITVRSTDAGIASAAAPGGVASFTLDGTARASGRRTHLIAALATSDGDLRFDADTEVPVGIDGGDPTGRLSGRVAGALGTGWLGQLFLPEDDRITGRIDVAVNLGGTRSAPTAIGNATGNLRYTSALTGMELRLDEIDLRAEGSRLRLATLKGNDGRAGVIDGRGTVDFAKGFADAVYDVEVAFLDTYIARLDELRLRGNGAVRLTGRGRAAVLKGGFSASEAVLRIPDRLPPDIATLPVEHLNIELSRNGSPVAGEDEGPAVPLGLDLALEFPARLRVEDPNLDSEWRGELFVRGDTTAPDVQGALEVLRGTFGLGGVQFRATEGSLSFDDSSNVPIVDVSAVANRHEIEATLRLHGRLDRPQIDLRSEPPLPQDEILSRLMFGTTTTTLTPGQSIQLAQAVARLSGRGPGLDVFGKVRRYVGVDRIEIKETTAEAGATPGTAVSVGKYVNDRVYVSLDQAVRGQGSKARVEVEISKHISAETEVGQDENALVGLKWRWNY